MKNTDKKIDTVYEVYYLGRTGKRISVQSFDDSQSAKEHLSQLRRLYGKYIQAGIKESTRSRFDRSVRDAEKTLSKRNREFGDKT